MNIDDILKREEPGKIPAWDDIRKRLIDLGVRRLSISIEMMDELIESERDDAAWFAEQGLDDGLDEDDDE